MHFVTMNHRTFEAENGLMLGNGDMYGIVWEVNGDTYMRVTKNDIWDARVDTSKDGPMPKVDVAAGTVTGSRGAPPSYKLPYPHPRCAAVIRFGADSKGANNRWGCIRKADQNSFGLQKDRKTAVMSVAGTKGASHF